MARPKSDDKRNAILSAAIRVIAAQGLGAPTAVIASEAGVSNGSLFTYFETKSDLLNQLYVELKTEMAEVALSGVSTDNGVREPLFQMWSHWLSWAVAHPDRRRTLAQLGVSNEVTAASHQTGSESMAGVARLLQRSLENGAMRDTPLVFVSALMNALAETTIDFMIQDPSHAEDHCQTGFEALWRMIG
jgi:AcrR family transcriptional regulator